MSIIAPLPQTMGEFKDDSTANLNMLWCSTIAKVLNLLGVEQAVLCPGSRNAPLCLAFELYSKIDTIVSIDERSAGFLAKGLSQRTKKPTVVICTSGTAVVNLFPSIVESFESGIPLIVITADRPLELLGCHSPQTIDQIKIFGNYVRWFHQFSLPEMRVCIFDYLRQTLLQGITKSLNPCPGPIHLNIPLIDPLYPIKDDSDDLKKLIEYVVNENFWSHLYPLSRMSLQGVNHQSLQDVIGNCLLCDRGLIIVGFLSEADAERKKFVKNVVDLSKTLDWPIFADVFNPLRHTSLEVDRMITQYDRILREKEFAESMYPKWIIFLGALPTSKILRNWISKSGAKLIYLDEQLENQDCLHGLSYHFPILLEDFLGKIELHENSEDSKGRGDGEWVKSWSEREGRIVSEMGSSLEEMDDMFEGKLMWVCSQHLGENTRIFIGTSTPIRDAEFFWMRSKKEFQFYYNRGANGIDGLISSAVGVAHNSEEPVVLIIGDLSFLHDINGLLFGRQLNGWLTIILINNEGGGIFDNMPISEHEARGAYEKCIVAGQRVDFRKLVEGHGLFYELVSTWGDLIEFMGRKRGKGIRVLEVRTDRRKDAKTRKAMFNANPKVSG